MGNVYSRPLPQGMLDFLLKTISCVLLLLLQVYTQVYLKLLKKKKINKNKKRERERQRKRASKPRRILVDCAVNDNGKVDTTRPIDVADGKVYRCQGSYELYWKDDGW